MYIYYIVFGNILSIVYDNCVPYKPQISNFKNIITP